ncbi:hypothetical protein ACFLZ4_01010 [Patescibacteria group bacterium]
MYRKIKNTLETVFVFLLVISFPVTVSLFASSIANEKREFLEQAVVFEDWEDIKDIGGLITVEVLDINEHTKCSSVGFVSCHTTYMVNALSPAGQEIWFETDLKLYDLQGQYIELYCAYKSKKNTVVCVDL